MVIRKSQAGIWKCTLLSIALSVLAISAWGQAAAPISPPAATTANPLADANYKIGPGDVIDVIVSKNETLSRSGLRVSNQGTVQLAMLDTDFQAACLTERQLADNIKEKYRKYLVDPYVSVAVKEFNASPVAVIGAVNAPGRFQLQRQLRFVELLALVNGPSPTAGETAEIIRNGSLPICNGPNLVSPDRSREELISVRLADAFQGGETANPVILAGDIVRVSPADQFNVYIQGNVMRGAAIPLNGLLTLTDAIAMAGGATSGAQLDKVKIRRPIPGSINRSDIIANVKEIKQGKRDDIVLEPNDIIEVPGPTGVTKFFNDLYKTVVPMVTSLPMRVIY